MGLEILSAIGLTKNEIKVYGVLFSQGSATAGQITKKVGLFRPRVYDALDRLVNKGMVSFVVINGIKNFQVSNPRRISDYVEEKELELKSLRTNEMEALINELEKRR